MEVTFAKGSITIDHKTMMGDLRKLFEVGSVIPASKRLSYRWLASILRAHTAPHQNPTKSVGFSP